MSQTTALSREDIDSGLKELKLAYENPKLYIATYFSELRNTVDIELEKFILNQEDAEQLELANEFQESMINNINNFEKECMSKLSSGSLSTEDSIEDRIEKLTEDVKYLDSYEDEKLNAVYDLIYYLMVEVQKILFSNQQLVFVSKNTQFFKEYLETSDCEVSMVSFGFLVKIEDEFIGKRGFFKQ